MAPIHSPIIQFRRSRLDEKEMAPRDVDGDSKIRVTYFSPSDAFCSIPPPIVKIHPSDFAVAGAANRKVETAKRFML
jgi:hypothetical protein